MSAPEIHAGMFDKRGLAEQLFQGGAFFFREPLIFELERLTDDDVMLLLKLIFHRQGTQELLKKMLEREKPENPLVY